MFAYNDVASQWHAVVVCLIASLPEQEVHTHAMNLQFNSLYIERFRSFNDPAEIAFDSAGPGLYYLSGRNDLDAALGSNGAGKSSILDALMWCLFGRTVQGLRNTDITPWSGKGQTIVEVELTIDDQVHNIRRTANPNSLSLNEKETSQEYIQELLTIPFEAVPYTIILGQRQPLFFDLAPKAQLDLFTSVMNLARWDNYAQHASEKASAQERDIQSIQSKIDVDSTLQGNCEKQIVDLKVRSQEWEEQRTSKSESHNKEVSALERELKPLQPRHDDANLAFDSTSTELRALEKQIRSAQGKERASSDVVSKIERTQSLLKSKIEDIKKKQDALDKEKCPTCGQNIKSHAEAKKIRSGLESDLLFLEEDLKNENTKYDQAFQDLEQAKNEIENLIEGENVLVAKRNAAEDVLHTLTPRIGNINAKLAALKRIKDEFTNADNPYKEQIQTLRRQKDVLKNQIQKNSSALVTVQQQCERVRFWIKGFKEVKLYVLEEVLQELEIATNALCDEFGLVGWRVTYDIERETKSKTVSRGLSITVLSPNNKQAVRWECWSGGEGQRLRIIGALALSNVLLNHAGVSVNLEVLDEPTESLSPEGVHDLVAALADRARMYDKNIFMIDHHVIQSKLFVDTILVTKDKNGSFIAE